jgi:hypothetical protein
MTLPYYIADTARFSMTTSGLRLGSGGLTTLRSVPDKPTFENMVAVLDRLVAVEVVYDYGSSRAIWLEVRWEDNPEVDAPGVLDSNGTERRVCRVGVGDAVPAPVEIVSGSTLL